MAWKTKVVPATTNNVTQAIINHLLAHGHSASRINVQGQWDQSLNDGVGGWRPSGSRKGVLDIGATLKPTGRSLWIDVKSGRDRLSKSQKEFIDEIRAAGGIAISAKTYDEYLNWYASYDPFEGLLIS